jgi:hypothetical protein
LNEVEEERSLKVVLACHSSEEELASSRSACLNEGEEERSLREVLVSHLSEEV